MFKKGMANQAAWYDIDQRLAQTTPDYSRIPSKDKGKGFLSLDDLKPKGPFRPRGPEPLNITKIEQATYSTNDPSQGRIIVNKVTFNDGTIHKAVTDERSNGLGAEGITIGPDNNATEDPKYGNMIPDDYDSPNMTSLNDADAEEIFESFGWDPRSIHDSITGREY